MAKYSISSYTADGTTTDFLLTWDYLDKTHIAVYVDGTNVADAGSGFTSTLINSTTVRVTTDLAAPVPAGKIVELRRETPIDTQAVTFNDGSSLNGGDLNTNTDYLLYAMQETIDTIDIAAQDGAAQASAAAAASAVEAEGFKNGAETAETNAAAFANAAATYRDQAQTAEANAAASAASLNIDQNVSTTGTPTFTSVTAGQVNSSGAVIATGAGQFGDDVSVTGDITVTGLVDGRDVAADGSSLDTLLTKVTLANWTIIESAGVLYFKSGGVNKMKLDASGNLTVVGEVTAYGSV